MGSSLIALAALAPSVSRAVEFVSVPPADLDFSNLGRIGIAGDFNGISLYEFEGQIAKPLSTNGSESLLMPLPNGAMASIVSSDASVLAMCPFKDGDTEGVIIGGNFTSLDGIKSTAMAFFNPTTGKVSPIDGLEGEVNAILCDNEQDVVYIGGNFKGANSTNAIAWLADSGWTNLPFAGFNGPVEAITKSSNGHIIFGGSFTGLGNVSTPTEPDGQTVNLATAEITAENSSPEEGFNNPKNIVCSTGSDGSGRTWLAADGKPGAWEANFAFNFLPTKLRLWNTHKDGRGTKTFRFTSFPINGIMNLTYVDPASGRNMSCSSECPLSDNPKIKFQDFHFVNQVGMNRFRISMSEWYGSGAGLAGVQLFQDDIFSYAIANFNEPTCRGIDFPSTATTTGPWSESPSLQSNSKYLTAKLSGPVAAGSASVVFVPNIIESGNYSINMYTPGCIPDGTCSTRGQVNITGVMSSNSDEVDFTTSLFQTNNFDKYDQIYFGYIEKTSENFKPKVTLTPLAGQDISEMVFVAQRVGFTLINSTGGLNGLYEFDPNNTVIDTSNFEDSAINKLGASFDENTGVTSLVTFDGTTYIGGNFTSDDHQNIVAIQDNKNVQSLDGGLNGQVLAMHLENTKLFVGGDFTNKLTNGKNGLNRVAVYDTKEKSWDTLGAGVNAKVEHIVPLRINITKDTPETVISLTGSFSECNAFGDSKASRVKGFAIWVPSKKNWLQNLKLAVPAYRGVLTSALLDLPNNNSLFAGSISSAQLGVNGAATLGNAGLGAFPVDIQEESPSSKKKRRDTLADGSLSGVVTGLFYDEDDKNMTILAGHFSAQTLNGTVVENLVLIDGKNGDSISGLGSGISSDSTFKTVALHGSVLYAGGKVSGTIDDGDVGGIVAYDLSSQSFISQPAPVAGGNGTVSAITVRPNTAEIYVGGSFTKAGALDCPGLCLYNPNSRQWTRPGNSLAGSVESLMWSSKTELIAGGDLRTNGSDTRFLATYNAKKQTWRDFPGTDRIPGPVHAMTPASSDGRQIWISGPSSDGSVYLMKYDGSQWRSAEQLLPSGSVIKSLQVFTLTKGHEKTDLLDDKQVLMLTGSIDIPNVGTVSAALFNGTTYQPYAFTTSSSNGAGSIARLFSQKDDFFSSGSKFPPCLMAHGLN